MNRSCDVKNDLKPGAGQQGDGSSRLPSFAVPGAPKDSSGREATPSRKSPRSDGGPEPCDGSARKSASPAGGVADKAYGSDESESDDALPPEKAGEGMEEERERRSPENPPSTALHTSYCPEVLVEAKPVADASSDDDFPLVEGRAVTLPSASDRPEKRRTVLVASGLVVVAMGVAIGVGLGIKSRTAPLSPETLPGTPSPNASPSPLFAPSRISWNPAVEPPLDERMRLFFDTLPNATRNSMQEADSAQSKAWNWLTRSDRFSKDVQWKLKQRFALVCLYFSTSKAAPWLLAPWFDNLLDECGWAGVACNHRGAVTQLAFPSSNVNGTLPPEFFFLSDLAMVNLSHNPIHGALPSEFSLLTHLVSLDLTNDLISGSVPSQLGLGALEWLSLAFNNISGVLPTELGMLTQLVHLDLSGNGNLSGTIPTELADLTNLQTLVLSGTGLNGTIPSELGGLSKLTTLDLRNTSLTGRVPSEVCRLSTLNGGGLSSIFVACEWVNCSCGCDCDGPA